MANDSKGKRSIFLINPDFQLSFVAYMIVAVLLCIFAFYLADLYFFKEMFKEGILMELPEDHIYFKMIVRQKSYMNSIFFFTGFFVFLFLVVFGLLLSHRIAGPIYKLDTHLKKLKNGEKVEKLNFRKNDYFKEMADSLNDYVELQNDSEEK